MKRFIVLLATAVVLSVAVASTATAASKPPTPQVIITKNCPAAKAQHTYKHNVIIYVSGNGCVSIDNGATAIASGDATVVAHGKSVVYAKDHVILVVYNRLVSCKIGMNVVLINASDFKDKYINCQH